MAPLWPPRNSIRVIRAIRVLRMSFCRCFCLWPIAYRQLRPLSRIRLVIDWHYLAAQTDRVTILLVCTDDQRLSRLQQIIQSAGFRTISAKGLDAAWTRTDFFDFDGVIIDHELANDVAASAFRQRYITLDCKEDTQPESLAIELTNLFCRGSELVH